MTNRLRPNNAGISENLLHQPSLQIMLPQAMLIQQKLMKIPIPRDKKDRKGSLGFGQAKRRFFMQRGNTEPYQPTPGAFARGSALRIRRVALRIQTQSALACPRRRMTKPLRTPQEQPLPQTPQKQPRPPPRRTPQEQPLPPRDHHARQVGGANPPANHPSPAPVSPAAPPRTPPRARDRQDCLGAGCTPKPIQGCSQ